MHHTGEHGKIVDNENNKTQNAAPSGHHSGAGGILRRQPAAKENMVRAEGTGTSPDVQMATEIARINAMTVLAAKAAPADTLTETTPDGIRTVETVNTPVFDVTEIDRRVFKNRTTGDFTVWILLEAEILP